MTSNTIAPTVANKVKELAFHTMIWLRSSPGIDKDTNMMMSNALNITRTIPKKIIAPTGILFRSFLHMVVRRLRNARTRINTGFFF